MMGVCVYGGGGVQGEQTIVLGLERLISVTPWKQRVFFQSQLKAMRTIVQGHLIERPMVGSPWGGPSGMDLFQVLLMRQMCDILGVARQSRCKDPRWWGQEVASVVERKWREERMDLIRTPYMHSWNFQMIKYNTGERGWKERGRQAEERAEGGKGGKEAGCMYRQCS